jgi:hypothetical protein
MSTAAPETSNIAATTTTKKVRAKRSPSGPRKGYVLWTIDTEKNEPVIGDFTFASDKAMDWQEANPSVNKVKRVTVEPQRNAAAKV